MAVSSVTCFLFHVGFPLFMLHLALSSLKAFQPLEISEAVVLPEWDKTIHSQLMQIQF